MPTNPHSQSQVMQAGTHGFINIEGQIVSVEFYDFVCRMKEHDENLELAWCDPDVAELGEEPFMILERCRDGNLRKIFGVWEINESVLDRIRLCDTNRIDILAQIDKTNAERERDQLRRYRDRSLETQSIVESIVRSEKSKFSYKDRETGEKVTIYEDRLPTREPAAPKNRIKTDGYPRTDSADSK